MLDRRLYLPWNRLTEALKTNRAQTWGDHPGHFEAISANPEDQRIFIEAMHSWSMQSGKSVAAAFDFSPYNQLIDVGGGSGAYCIEAARRYPHLCAVVFDLSAALMSLNMLIETEGRNYTWAEYTEWLEEIGFKEIQRVTVESPGANGLLIGRKRC